MGSATTLTAAPELTTKTTDEHGVSQHTHALLTPVVQQWIDEGKHNPEGLWGRAANNLPWFRKWDRVLDWTPPTFKWFVGAQTNLAYNALDHHVRRGWGGHHYSRRWN